MQATYVMAANKEALPYLPAGADVNALTYEQLIEWGKNMQDEDRPARSSAFPAGPKGLMARFFQGYLYPSFTGGVVRTFQTADAAAGWEKLKALWAVVTPNSTSYDFMQEPLLAGEVMVAWDHIARAEGRHFRRSRTITSSSRRPPGPKGRGYMPVVAGLAIPKGAPDKAGAEKVIEHLIDAGDAAHDRRRGRLLPDAERQAAAGSRSPASSCSPVRVAATQAPRTRSSRCCPVGLGDKGGEFNKVYMDTFQRIVLQQRARRRRARRPRARRWPS